MPVKPDAQLWIMVDVETSGPVYGRHSLTELGAAVGSVARGVVDRFAALVRPIGDEVVASRDSFERARAQGAEPREALQRFAEWARPYREQQARFVARPSAFDWPWIVYYAWCYLGQNPFGFTAACASSWFEARGKRFRVDLPHVAVEDAEIQLRHFLRELAASLETGAHRCVRCYGPVEDARRRPTVCRSCGSVVSSASDVVPLAGIQMTETEWAASADPGKMLLSVRDRVSARKLRLFACACCARLRPPITEPRNELPGAAARALEVAERYADGLAEEDELVRAQEGARAAAAVEAWGSEWRAAATEAVSAATGTSHWGEMLIPVESARQAAWEAAEAAGGRAGDRGSFAEVRAAQAHLLRDILGDRFHPPRVAPAWLQANGGRAAQLARDIYDRQSFEDLPDLAAALIRAGCRDDRVLSHCRPPGEHVRGCWLLDLILGRE